MLVLAMALSVLMQGPTGGYLFQEPSPASRIRGLEGDAASSPVLGLREALDRCYAWAVGEATLRPRSQDKHITLIEKWNCTSLQQVPSPNP